MHHSTKAYKLFLIKASNVEMKLVTRCDEPLHSWGCNTRFYRHCWRQCEGVLYKTVGNWTPIGRHTL